MRGISKPCPPCDVRYRDDNQASTSLGEAENDYLARLGEVSNNKTHFARLEFDKLKKYKLRRTMYREQGSICVYCEQEIAEGDQIPRIDHWCPLSCDPRLALCWQNLYLSCTSPETCDTAKGAHRLRWNDADDDLPWPVDFPYEDVVGFSSLGEIYVRADAEMPEATRRALEFVIGKPTDGDKVQPGIVNLNHRKLVKARAAVVATERMETKTVTVEEREVRAASLLDSNPLPAFVSIRVAYLRMQLGRGR